MTPEQFCYWLQGYVEIYNDNVVASPTYTEWKVIKDHLALVFEKKTPDYSKQSLPPIHLPPYISKTIC